MILKPRTICRPIKGHWATRGLIAFWGMMPYEFGGNKVFDLSGNANTGTLTGTAPSWTAGKHGSAVLLPGTDEYINLPRGMVDDLQSCTVCAWINRNSAGHVDALLNAMDGSTNYGYVFWYYIGEDDKITLRIRAGSGATDAVFGSTDNTVPAGVCKQIVLVIESGVGNKIYVDGLEESMSYTTGNSSSDTCFGDIGGASLYNHIGAMMYRGDFSAWGAAKYAGCILYNRALSASEIALRCREPFIRYRWTLPELIHYYSAPVGNAGIMTPNTGFWGPTF